MMEAIGRDDGELWPGLLYLGERESGGDMVHFPSPPSAAKICSIVMRLAWWAGAMRLSFDVAHGPSLLSGM